MSFNSHEWMREMLQLISALFFQFFFEVHNGEYFIDFALPLRNANILTISGYRIFSALSIQALISSESTAGLSGRISYRRRRVRCLLWWRFPWLIVIWILRTLCVPYFLLVRSLIRQVDSSRLLSAPCKWAYRFSNWICFERCISLSMYPVHETYSDVKIDAISRFWRTSQRASIIK